MTENTNEEVLLLFNATENNDLDSVKNLIENNIELYINIKNNNEDTPLYLAIKNGSSEIVDFLLDTEKIASKNKKNKEILDKFLYDMLIKAIKDHDVELFEKIASNKNFKFKDGERENEILFFIIDMIKKKKNNKNDDFIKMLQILLENKNIELDLTQKIQKRIRKLGGKRVGEEITPLNRLICDIDLILPGQDFLEYFIKNYPESENNINDDLIITDNISKNNNNLFHNICEIYKSKITDTTDFKVQTAIILKTLFDKVKNKKKYINAKNINDNTPLDLALSADNNEAVNFLIRQEEIDFSIVKQENRKALLFNFIINKENILFKEYFNKDYLKDNFTINNIAEKFLDYAQKTMNKDLVKTIIEYTLKNIDSIDHSKDNGDKISDIKKLLKVLITNENPYLDIINDTLNKINKECLKQIKDENLEDFQIEECNKEKEIKYFIKEIKNVRKCYAKYSGGNIEDFQGLNQLVVNRIFNYNNDGNLLSITDRAFKIDTNDIVYKKIKNSGIEEENITYYKKDTKEENENNKLIEAVIDENRYIKFDNCKVEDFEKEVNDILNSYENPIGFDDILSYLEYSLIKLNKNNKDFSVKVSHREDFNGIVDTFYESSKNKEKIYFYNLSSTGHNVQLIICDSKIVLFNTGIEFDYKCIKIQDRIKIDNRYNELPEDIKNNLNVTEFKVLEQTIGNCNLSSKIFVVNFTNNNIDEDFSKLLNDIKQLQDYKGIEKNLNLSSNMLKLNCQIYNENKNNYLIISEHFAKIVKNIEDSITEEYEKIRNNKKDNNEKFEEYESLIKKISLLEIKIIKESKDELKHINYIYNLLDKKDEDLKKLKEEKEYIKKIIFDLNNKTITEDIAIKNLKDKEIKLKVEEKIENSFINRLEKLKLDKEKMILEKTDDIKKNKELKNGLQNRKNNLKKIINLFSKKNIEQFF